MYRSEDKYIHISSSFADSPIWATAFLRRFCQIASGFHFFGWLKKGGWMDTVRQTARQT
jgi:hypothetical protein